MRIAIFGAGGVGGYFGGRLAQAGLDVTFVARGEHGRTIRNDGLTVASIAGDFHVDGAAVVEDPGAAGPFDLVLVAVKAWQIDDAARALVPAVGPGSAVIPLLNGVEAPDALAAVLEPRSVLGGLCGILAWIDRPGHVRHAAIDPFIRLGERDGTASDRARDIAVALDQAEGMSVAAADDVRVAMWQKFLFIVAMSGVGAVTRAPIGATRTDAAARELLLACMHEVHAVGRALGVALPDDAVERTASMMDALPPDGTASMQRDVMDGRPSELAAQNAAVVRLGARAGVDTPVNAYIAAALSPQERRARGEVDF